jgi:hypothetical protein
MLLESSFAGAQFCSYVEMLHFGGTPYITTIPVIYTTKRLYLTVSKGTISWRSWPTIANDAIPETEVLNKQLSISIAFSRFLKIQSRN